MRFFILLFFLVSKFSYADDSQKRYKSLREKLYGDMQVFERMFRDDADFLKLNEDMEKLLREHMKQFGGSFDENEMFGHSLSQDGFFWKEDDKNRILVIKMKMPKDSPLDIKIEKNQVVITGKIKNGISESQFSKVSSIPDDVDIKNLKTEVLKDGTVQMIFPKIKESSVKKMKKEVSPHSDSLSI